MRIDVILFLNSLNKAVYKKKDVVICVTVFAVNILLFYPLSSRHPSPPNALSSECALSSGKNNIIRRDHKYATN